MTAHAFAGCLAAAAVGCAALAHTPGPGADFIVRAWSRTLSTAASLCAAGAALVILASL